MSNIFSLQFFIKYVTGLISEYVAECLSLWLVFLSFVLCRKHNYFYFVIYTERATGNRNFEFVATKVFVHEIMFRVMSSCNICRYIRVHLWYISVYMGKVRQAALYQATEPTPTVYSLITHFTSLHFTSLFFHIVIFSVDALETNVWTLSEYKASH
jgi:hypothetical protein